MPGFILGKRFSILFTVFSLLACGCATVPDSSAMGEEAEAIDDLLAQEYRQTAATEARAGNYDAAVSLYMQAVRIDESPAGWMVVGDLNLRQGKDGAAASAYEHALQLDPEHALAAQGLGLILLKRGNTDDAKIILEEAVRLGANSWRALNGLGVMSDMAEQYDAAVGYYEQALKIRPASAMLLTNLGYSHYLNRNFQTAELTFRKALAFDQKYEPAWSNLGLVQARLRRYDESLDILIRVMETRKAYNDIGYIAYQNKDFPEAEVLLRRAIDLSPVHYTKAHDNLALVTAEFDKPSLLSTVASVEQPSGDCRTSAYPDVCTSCAATEDSQQCMLTFVLSLGQK